MTTRFYESTAFSTGTTEWRTPHWLFRELNIQFHFGLDPCATKANALCKNFFSKEDDGLSQDWTGYGPVFMNPPYGRSVNCWMQKALESAAHGATVVCLIPARTDTSWWHDCVIGHPKSDGVEREVRFLRGRVDFRGMPSTRRSRAPFASAIVIMKPKNRIKEGVE